MPVPVVLLVLLAMMLGLLGTLMPVLPGLTLIWGAALASFLTVGFGGLAWATMATLTLLLVAGAAAKYVLPGRQGGQPVPARSLWWAATGAVMGFVVVPVVGFVLGGVAGLYLAETRRTGSSEAAGRITMVALKRFGIGVLVEVAAGVSMIVVWLMAVVLVR